MRKQIIRNQVLAVCIVAVLLAMVLFTGCTSTPISISRAIAVTGTLDGSPWGGPVSFTLTASGLPTISGTSVNQIFINKPVGTYTTTYVSGGPPNARFVDTTPIGMQALTDNGTIAFVLNFKTSTNVKVEATLNGVPWSGPLNYDVKGWLNFDFLSNFSSLQPNLPTFDPTAPNFSPSDLGSLFVVPPPSSSYSSSFSTYSGSSVPQTFTNVAEGSIWNDGSIPLSPVSGYGALYGISNVNGGPPGATLTSITPADPFLISGNTKTFTIHFVNDKLPNDTIDKSTLGGTAKSTNIGTRILVQSKETPTGGSVLEATLTSTSDGKPLSGKALVFSGTQTIAGTGTVVILGTGKTGNDGTASLRYIDFLNRLPDGPDSVAISVSFAGDADYGASTGTGTLTITPAGNTGPASVTVDVTIVTAGGTSASSSVYGQPVTFTATVTANAPGAGTPTGSIRFIQGGGSGFATNYLAAVDIAGNTAAYTTASLATGTHNIVAVYQGDSNFNPATSAAPQIFTVNKAITTITLRSSTSPSVFGQPVTFTATVTANAPGAGTPTGSVMILNGPPFLTNQGGFDTGITLALSGNLATFTTASLAAGTHTITATYSGDTNYATSTIPMTLTVTPVPATAITATTGTIIVNATLDGAVWTGPVGFTVSGTSLFSGSYVPQTFTDYPVGTYTIGSIIGGPNGGTFTNVTSSATQTLNAGDIMTFTLNFTTRQ